MPTYQTVNLTTLRARVRDRTESSPFWTDEEARLAINEALRLWNGFTGQWREEVTILTHPDDQFVSLPGPLIWPMSVSWNGRPLTRVSYSELDAGRPGWQSETTIDGGGVPDVVQAWAPISLALIAIWPRDGAGTGLLTADGIAQTPVLVNPGDFVDLSEGRLDPLIGYAFHRLAFKSPLFPTTLGLYQDFLRAAGDQNAAFRASTLYKTLLLGQPDEKRRPSREPNTPPPLPGVDGAAA